MKLNFIFSNVRVIMAIFQTTFLIIGVICFYRPARVKNISLLKLILAAVGLNLFYALFITWGQYYVWSISSDLSKIFLHLPLPKDAPLSFYLEWTRPFFENQSGYFLYYVLGRTWLDTFLLFVTSGALYLLFRAWKLYRGGFAEQGPELLLFLMLISGWSGNLICILLGFILSILWYLCSYLRGERVIKIEPAFILAAFISLLSARYILNML